MALYIQDEWKLLPRLLTAGHGVRYDQYKAFDAEDQISPRANLVWTPTDTTTVHGGYARYFSPPPIELQVAITDIAPVRQQHGGGRSYRRHAARRACGLCMISAWRRSCSRA